jgi:hypothetical protein
LPTTSWKIGGAPCWASTRVTIFCTATAQSGVGDAGFQMVVSPHTAAMSAFHAHTATGKLKAVMQPTGPSGCHCSNIRWPGRSECIDRP